MTEPIRVPTMWTQATASQAKAEVPVIRCSRCGEDRLVDETRQGWFCAVCGKTFTP